MHIVIIIIIAFLQPYLSVVCAAACKKMFGLGTTAPRAEGVNSAAPRDKVLRVPLEGELAYSVLVDSCSLQQIHQRASLSWQSIHCRP